MVSIEDVSTAYRFILGRDPENEQVAADTARHVGSLADLRLALMASDEFRQNFRRNFEINVPPPADLPHDASPASPDALANVTFLQTCDPYDYLGMLAASSQSVRQYCAKHQYRYEVYIGLKQGYFPWHACFNRIFLLKELWERGFRGWAIYLDADAIIVDQDFDLPGYLADKATFAAIFAHVGVGPWWNVNNGVMIFNYSHPWTEWLIRRYHVMFMELCYPHLRNATNWHSIPHDQDLLHEILARSELNRPYVFFEDLNILNCTRPPSEATFIYQVLRGHVGVEERVAKIAARVAEIVSEPPATWQANLLRLLSQQNVSGGDQPTFETMLPTSTMCGILRGSSPARELARVQSPARPLNWPPIRVDVEATPAQLAAMAARIEKSWSHLGASDPHWSVLTSDRFRSQNMASSEVEFYETGKIDIENLYCTAARCGVDLAELNNCFELGCGVGRVTYWLAERFEQVTAADISTIHLDNARKAVQSGKRTNVRLVHLNSLDVFKDIPQFDVFISTIVLQHNPPPLIALLLRTALRKLRPDGIAYFQVPTYRENYRFVVEEYLADTAPHGAMEMHVLPQRVLFEILQQCGCRVLECREDSYTGDFATISNSIMARKDAVSSGQTGRGSRAGFLRGLDFAFSSWRR